MRYVSFVSLVALASTCVAASGNVIDFSDQSLPANSYNDGGPVSNSAGFNTGGAFLNNTYSLSYGGYWTGFSLTNVQNNGSDYPTVADYAGNHEYAAYPGSGPNPLTPNAVYAVEYGAAGFINLPAGQQPVSIALTNDTYTALSMTYGDGFAKKFGPTDYFDVTLTGYTNPGAKGFVTGSATFYLAQNGTVNDTWTPVALAGLGTATSIGFSYASSDVSQYGINTPEYVALDDLVTTAAVPEPTSVGLLILAGVAGLAKRRRIAR